ncbi:MAG: clan AA aspartic protease [Planctomycetota bacterium]
MITGIVTPDQEATIRLDVQGPGGSGQTVEAVVDTGFDGWLSLPSVLIGALGLHWRERGRAILADSSETIFDIYEGTVVWDGQPRRVPVDEAETAPLIGMSLLGGYELNIQVRIGGVVSITAMAGPPTG